MLTIICQIRTLKSCSCSNVYNTGPEWHRKPKPLLTPSHSTLLDISTQVWQTRLNMDTFIYKTLLFNINNTQSRKRAPYKSDILLYIFTFIWWSLMKLANGVGWRKHLLCFWTWLEFELAVKVTQLIGQKACSVLYAASPTCPEKTCSAYFSNCSRNLGLNMLTRIRHMDRKRGVRSPADLEYDHESTGYCS